MPKFYLKEKEVNKVLELIENEIQRTTFNTQVCDLRCLFLKNQHYHRCDESTSLSIEREVDIVYYFDQWNIRINNFYARLKTQVCPFCGDNLVDFDKMEEGIEKFDKFLQEIVEG